MRAVPDGHPVRHVAKLPTSLKLLFVVFTLLLVTTNYVCAIEVSREFSSDGWKVRYVLSSDAAEPSSLLTLNLEIEAKMNSYDFELWVSPTPPLTVSRQGSSDPHVKYSEFKAGERHLEVFTISVPSTVKEKEIYSITIRAQSFSSPAAFGAVRLPGLPPDYQYDTSSDPSKMLFVRITVIPHLVVGETSAPASVTRGDTFSVTITFANKGTGVAEAGRILVSSSIGLKLLSVTGFTNGSNIQPGHSVVLTLSLQAVKDGAQSLDTVLMSSNADSAKQSIQIDVRKPLIEQMDQFLKSSLFAIMLILIIIFGAIVIYRKLHSNVY